VREHRGLPERRDDLLRPVAIANEDDSARGDREPVALCLGEQRALGYLRAMTNTAPRRSQVAPDVRDVDLAHPRRQLLIAPAAAPPPARHRVPPPAAAADRAAPAAEELTQPAAIWLLRQQLGHVDGQLKIAPHRRQLTRHPRVLRMVGQVLAPLGSAHLVDPREDLVQRSELLQQVSRSLVADPGTPGILSDVIALEPIEVWNQLRCDAVAIDDRLAVVELRLRDPRAVAITLTSPSSSIS